MPDGIKCHHAQTAYSDIMSWQYRLTSSHDIRHWRHAITQCPDMIHQHIHMETDTDMALSYDSGIITLEHTQTWCNGITAYSDLVWPHSGMMPDSIKWSHTLTTYNDIIHWQHAFSSCIYSIHWHNVPTSHTDMVSWHEWYHKLAWSHDSI